MRGNKKSLLDRTSLDTSWDTSDIEDDLVSPRLGDNFKNNNDYKQSNNSSSYPANPGLSLDHSQASTSNRLDSFNISQDEEEDSQVTDISDVTNNSRAKTPSNRAGNGNDDTVNTTGNSGANGLLPLYLYDSDETVDFDDETSGYRSPAPSRLSNSLCYTERSQVTEGSGEEAEESLMEIQIQTLTGTTFRVRVSSRETARGLKNLLHRTEGLLWNQQHLLLGQKELVDDITLSEQGVQHGSVLRLIISLKGGPINARRNLPPDDLLWREVSDIMDDKKEELWDSSGGRAVTLLVLRDGDAVNLYRVLEHEDGSFSPLSQSWASSTNGGLDRSIGSRVDEDSKTQETLLELRQKMEALKLRNRQKKKKQRSANKKKSPNHTSKTPTIPEKPPTHKMPKQRYVTDVPPELVTDVTSRVKASKLDHRRPKSGGHRRTSTRRGTSRHSRPSTQERSIEMRKTSVSRTAVMMDEFPHSLPPRDFHFSGKKPLEGIKPRNERPRLGKVNEHEASKQSDVREPTSRQHKNESENIYSEYRKSLVRYGKDNSTNRRIADNDVKPEAVAPPHRNNPPVPFYISTPQSRPRRDVDPLYSSHNNFDRLPLPRDYGNRPKTSPEILERQPSSLPGSAKERINIRDPDPQLMDLMNILNSSRRRSIDVASRSFSTSMDLRGMRRNSLAGFGSQATTPRKAITPSFGGMSKPSSASMSTFGSSNLATSTMGSTSSTGHNELLRQLIRSQVAPNVLPSRKSTPEKKGRRPVSGRGHVPASPARLPPVTPSRKKRSKPRCLQCNRRITIASTHSCRCGGLFCAQHRYSETHSCTFDYKSEGRKLLQISNPLVEPQKLPKI